MRKLFSMTFTVFLLILLIVSMSIAVSAADDIASGTCGDNLTWTLNSEGTLTVSGTGPMDDYPYPFFSSGIIYPKYPWRDVAASIKRVVIQEGVTSIGEAAFVICPNLTDVTISDSVVDIGDSAFERCAALTHVTFGKSLVNIGASAFHLCESLTEIIIPDGVTEIGRSAFNGCYTLKKVTLPQNLTVINPGVFLHCQALTSISIPDGVTSIGQQAFFGCQKLCAVLLPSQLETINDMAFHGCLILERVYYRGSSQDWTKITIGSHREYLNKATIIRSFTGDAPIGTIVFKDWDGTILSEKTHYWGDRIYIPKAPARSADDCCTYTFEGWDKTVSETCAGDATYTATYSVASTSGDPIAPTVPSAPTEPETPSHPENGKDWSNIVVIVSVVTVSAAVIIAVILRKKKQ